TAALLDRANQSHRSVGPHHWRGRPRAIGYFNFRPVRSHEEGKISVLGGREPVTAFPLRRRISLHVDRQRSIIVILERLALSSHRVALDVVGRKEVMLVVERKRPETPYWRRLILCKGDGVPVDTV